MVAKISKKVNSDTFFCFLSWSYTKIIHSFLFKKTIKMCLNVFFIGSLIFKSQKSTQT